MTKRMSKRATDKLFTYNQKRNREAQQLPDFECTKCGEQAHPHFYVWATAFAMHDKKFCFACLHWYGFHKLVQALPRKHFVARGHGYTVGDEHPKSYPGSRRSRGFGGALFIFTHPNGTIQQSTNMWHQGKVDKAWLEDLPNTVTFIKG